MISTHIIDKKLILTVEDNGDGMTEQQIDSILKEQVKDRKHFNGIGIPNVKERIQLFFGKEYVQITLKRNASSATAERLFHF